jgi:putative ABC transport system permease protein
MSWLRRLLNTFVPGRVERDLDRERSFHIAERVDELRAASATERDARRLARLQFGNPIVQSERTRNVDVAGWVDGALRNIRYAVRTLSRTPGFTVTVVLTLALGVGANTAVFSAIDTVLLRPLPFPDGARLVLLTHTQKGSGETRIAPARLQDWNKLNATFEGIAGHGTNLRHIRALSRGTDHCDHQRSPLAQLGSRSTDVAAPRRSGNVSISTIGVMSEDFQFPANDVDVWSADDADATWGQSRALTWFTGIGRLLPGVTLAQAQADLDRVQALLAQQHPGTDHGIGVQITPLKDAVVGDSRASLWLLFGSVSVLLLIACTNIAALLLSRAAKREQEITALAFVCAGVYGTLSHAVSLRRREVALRLALGALRRNVVHQLMTTTIRIVGIATARGLLIALLFTQTLSTMLYGVTPADPPTLGGVLIVVVGVALVSALIPAARATFVQPMRALRED